MQMNLLNSKLADTLTVYLSEGNSELSEVIQVKECINKMLPFDIMKKNHKPIEEFNLMEIHTCSGIIWTLNKNNKDLNQSLADLVIAIQQQKALVEKDQQSQQDLEDEMRTTGKTAEEILNKRK